MTIVEEYKVAVSDYLKFSKFKGNIRMSDFEKRINNYIKINDPDLLSRMRDSKRTFKSDLRQKYYMELGARHRQVGCSSCGGELIWE